MLSRGEGDSDLETLLEDETEVNIYLNGTQQNFQVKELAEQALGSSKVATQLAENPLDLKPGKGRSESLNSKSETKSNDQSTKFKK